MEVFRALKQKKGGEKGSKGKPKREGERPGHKRKSKSKAEGSKERTSKKIDETGEADLLAASEILSMASSESRGSPSSSVVAATAPISSSSVAIAAPTTPSIEELMKRIAKMEQALLARQEEENTGRVALAPQK